MWDQVFGDAPTWTLTYALDPDGQRVEGDPTPDEMQAWMHGRW
ncbi:MAG: hypothetical protein ACI9VR_004357 [Cognaticolwellia sp.]|jgi:hypothetical protein